MSTYGIAPRAFFALTFPQFLAMARHCQRLRALRARDEVYFGVSGAFGDDKARKSLFDLAGSYEKDFEADYDSVDADALRIAQERMKKITEKLDG